MKSKFLTIFAAIGISTFGLGCAHYHKIEGREEKSEIPEGVRVNIGSSEVKAGDSVDVFKRKCVKNKMHHKGASAEKCFLLHFIKTFRDQNRSLRARYFNVFILKATFFLGHLV